ncbi:MAG: biotin--acetyl-CoA-carboxylase ligase, partial [Desulfovibrio sp.]|nr:biotin--acetyl-CoA-carboxylase ligase [Desulfovibrio sp.]
MLAAEALGALGWPVAIKWPNDLVLETHTGPRKVAGILLEERGGTLLAGIGVNVASHPPAETLRAGAALEAASLAEGGRDS